ncbi:Ribosomal RNA small subunit methyltransferase G [Roseivivax sp. THAF40]|uniref:16S rRNA (guanine(527)-N(7))-methyltransferase RsmG n=1 Tax=unclassified Roseivivax TaxID=2639302 RepID=UPI0012697326|nr:MULTISPECIES: 16S rRNA (guanine(527)-N(7))-methyltransferase RsmG [unclassified Roseivivax]QFS84725.1 Ribosomal RNA small subunit methyltransferase G [Roseivivax sp. THAF197b]QFT48552.1 Ribosomal RNA small subunit methyltransferase G [Roseivivax sp. THAF40]
MTPPIANTDVSRETLDKLRQYEDLVRHWTQRINLISKASVDDLWERHILDALQLARFIPPEGGHWMDLGSGGGFPGIVIAIAAQELNPHMRMTLVESDARKSVFLRTAVRQFNLNAEVKTTRIEKLPRIRADVISARALSALTTLLSYAHPHMKAGTHCVFPKGTTWKKEVEDARKEWSFSCEITTSETDPNAVILSIGSLAHV